MRLYILPAGGLFASDATVALPAKIEPYPPAAREVLLDEKKLPESKDGSFVLNASLRNGVHTITVDGTLCESVIVSNGRVRPSGDGLRRVLSAMVMLHDIELRIKALEQRASEKEVNWLL